MPCPARAAGDTEVVEKPSRSSRTSARLLIQQVPREADSEMATGVEGVVSGVVSGGTRGREKLSPSEGLSAPRGALGLRYPLRPVPGWGERFRHLCCHPVLPLEMGLPLEGGVTLHGADFLQSREPPQRADS